MPLTCNWGDTPAYKMLKPIWDSIDTPDVTTTVPAVTTTTVVPVTTTTVVRTPRTTVPGRDDDDSRKPKKPLRPAPRPRDFELRYGDDSARNTLFAAWVDDNTPDAYTIECSRLAGGVNAPVENTITFTKDDAVNGERGRHRYAMPIIPAAGSRCRMFSLVVTVPSERSNAAIVPPARRRDEKRPPVTTTTVPVTTTTVPVTTTTEPVTTTTEPVTTTTVSGAKAGVQVTPVKPSPVTTVRPAAPPVTVKKPAAPVTVPKKKP